MSAKPCQSSAEARADSTDVGPVWRQRMAWSRCGSIDRSCACCKASCRAQIVALSWVGRLAHEAYTFMQIADKDLYDYSTYLYKCRKARRKRPLGTFWGVRCSGAP